MEVLCGDRVYVQPELHSVSGEVERFTQRMAIIRVVCRVFAAWFFVTHEDVENIGISVNPKLSTGIFKP